jgi:glutaconate CoA-transferase subunit B
MSGDWTGRELMTVAASRVLDDDDVCFVGIGPPSAACNLARLTHSPGLTLIYESGTLGTTPDILPLSIGDGILADASITTVSVPEMFAYWLQGGHVTVGFLAAAQMDRFGNLNTTVIGGYDPPKVRLPGGGGAPEIATLCRQTYVIMPHTVRGMVERLDFVTSLGHGPTGVERRRLGVTTAGPTRVFTDLCIMQPHPEDNELQVTSLHPGVGRDDVAEATGWRLRFADDVDATPPPTAEELSVLRDLHRRSGEAHAGTQR